MTRRSYVGQSLFVDELYQTGQALMTTWPKYHRDRGRRQRLFRRKARTILSLACVPQPRIGSFHFHNDSTISLTNRPLALTIVLLQNNGATRTILRNDTYQSTDPFAPDMLTFHDCSFLNHPDASWSEAQFQADLADW
ncbi:hypothetical protein MAPG_10623 [Magnaporthiopsis poae ATCC 64411]|uniref:Uncharacterized protein n=1 Tax=Magnaporthiopsis poae (strain ATCC 64411 / 73-15) TaxID=644358 RepID=A0A0C4ED30_MAGP6|nr:hypothetical protein MAPG_10623 [Magnaporthiopsis poae ATCC 64411]